MNKKVTVPLGFLWDCEMHYWRERYGFCLRPTDKIKDLRAIYSDNDNVSSTLLLLVTGAAELFVYHLFDPRCAFYIMPAADAARLTSPVKKDGNFIENASTDAAEIIIIRFTSVFFLFIYGSIISFQEGLDFQLRQRAGKCACLRINISTHSTIYAIGARRRRRKKKVFISLALQPRHNTKCAATWHLPLFIHINFSFFII